MPRRSSYFLVLFLVASALLVHPSIAAPLGRSPDSTQPTATLTSIPGLPSGLKILGAEIDEPGGSDRQLTASQATAFLQSWLAESVFGNVTSLTPTAKFPYSTISLSAEYDGRRYSFRAFLTCTSERTWVGMPPQALWPGAFVDRERWFASGSSEEVLAGYNGDLSVLRADGTGGDPEPGANTSCPFKSKDNPQFEPMSSETPKSTTTAPTEVSTPERTSPRTIQEADSNAAIWLLLVVVLLVVLGLIVMQWRRRNA